MTNPDTKTKEQYEKQIFDLQQLLEISKSLNSNLDYNILISSILYTCMGQTKAQNAGLFARRSIVDQDFTLHRTYKGFDLDHSIDYVIKHDHPVFKLLHKQSGAFTLQEIRKSLSSVEGLEALIHLDPQLVIPLKNQDKINGLLVLGDKIDGDDFSESEQEFLLSVATFAAIAIHNAFLFEMTTTDMMTRLKTKHFFLNALLEILEEACNSDQDVSLVMMDLDHFKRLNDTYGHICGDFVLQKVSEVISKHIRHVDIAARYGGEEFVVLLPESGIGQAQMIAERIRQALEAEIIEFDGVKHNVTISIGIAQFDPLKDITSLKFIDRADKGLYLSKQNGRNQVTVV